MSYQNFIEDTLDNNYFNIIKSREDGSCCYNSFLTSLKMSDLKIQKNLN